MTAFGSTRFSTKYRIPFEPEPLSYEFYLVKSQELPQTDPSSGKYQKFIDGWSRLPLPLARAIGPPLARLLG